MKISDANEVRELEVGTKFWIYYIRFSSSGRVIRIVRPTLAEVIRNNCSGPVFRMKNGDQKVVNPSIVSCGAEIFQYIGTDQGECIASWNDVINRKMNKVFYKYNQIIDNLGKKIIQI